jgi:hypothetical protein
MLWVRSWKAGCDKLAQYAFPWKRYTEMLNRVDGNRKLLQELVEMFFQDYSEDIKKLRSLWKRKTLPPWLLWFTALKVSLEIG